MNRLPPRIALLLVLLLAGCSSTTFVYNRLHVFIPWYVDDYVNLDRRQDDTLDALLVTYLDHHRLAHLPRYVDLVDRALAMLDEPLTEARINELYRHSRAELVRLQEESLTWLLPIGEALTEAQMEDFVSNLREQQEEDAEEYLERDDDKFREETYDNLEETLSDYLGRLDRRQEARLREATAELQRWDSLWLEERGRWFDQLAEALQRQPGWQEQVRQLVVNRYRRSPQAYRQTFDHNLEVVTAALVAVINARSARQDLHLRDKLGELRGDLCRLVEQGLEADAGGQALVPACVTAGPGA